MEHKEGRREELERLYESLTPEERRTRIILAPAFRDAYNELTQAHKLVPVPKYFWDKWVPVLGPVASMLYMKLRQYCYYNPETGEKRDMCWPKQETLGKEIGVSKRTVMRTLPELERHGFIKREANYRMGPHGAPNRATDVYRIFFEIPLVAEDAAELLIRETSSEHSDSFVPESPLMAQAEAGNGSSSYERQSGTHRKNSYEGQIGTHREPVDNSAYKFQFGTHIAVPDCHRRTNTRTNTTNVSNVCENEDREKKKRRSLREHPALKGLTQGQLEEKEHLAFEIGEQLKVMAGDGDLKPHKSEGFHKKVAFLMPGHLVREALMATRDAVDDHRSGRKRLRGSPAAYFAGIVKKIAAREDVDLEIQGW